jgi:hypothetical protein
VVDIGGKFAAGIVDSGGKFATCINSTWNWRIACKADHFSNIPLGELSLEENKMEASLKFCLPSAVFIFMKVFVYPTIPTVPSRIQFCQFCT